MHTLSTTLLLGSALALSGCLGGGGSGGGNSGSIGDTAPGGLYLGYYQEDPATNPEDPVPGAYLLELPANNASFSGAMRFSYVGCQSQGDGTVSGNKSGYALAGSWSGTVDGRAIDGSYQGQYDAANHRYSGSYSKSGGKLHINVPGCIDYYVGPSGSWSMYPADSSTPAGFTLSINANTVSWPALAGNTLSLNYVVAPELTRSGGKAVLCQRLGSSHATSWPLAGSCTLQAGKRYLAVVLVSDSSYRQLGFASRSFTAP